MIIAAFKVIGLAGLLSQAAAKFPDIAVAKLCAGIAELDSSAKATSVCRQTENEARDRLRVLWPKLEASEKTVCAGETDFAIPWSYVEIAGCLDMNRELQREKSLARRAPVSPRS